MRDRGGSEENSGIVGAVAGSPTAAWLPKRPELAPAEVSGPRFASAEAAAPHGPSRLQTGGRATRPFRFGSEDRPDPDPPLAIGSVIGDRYRIQRLLGEGGMGRVYEAQHIVLRRRVALKLLRRDAAAQAENLARFRQEALAASRIGAPEIVEVVDFASHPVAGGQQTYMVMELLAGESLEAWMDRSARLDEGLTILASLCDGLAAAHRASVVHRDIKPANVFLPAAEPTHPSTVRVKILDFGIAKITAGGEGFQTRQGSLLGTPYYLAPERVMGAELTGAADLYSVGVILYEMLTGNVPFVADSFMGILANHVHTQPLDPRQAMPERAIPDAVAQLCMRLLDKDPYSRPSAEQVAGELRGMLAHDAGVLATVAIGPAAISTASVDTQVMADATRKLASEPLASSARALTQIGHAPAATSAMTQPVVHASAVSQAPREPASRKLALALIGVLAAGGLTSLAWLLLRDQQGDQQRARSSEPTELAAEHPAAEPRDVTPIEPEPAPVAPIASSIEATKEPPAELAPAVERELREPPQERKRKRSSKPKSAPKPAAQPTDEPAPKPDPEPSQPPAPEPKPDALPTIKDDVYD